ncbi:hypothetical protein CTAYLR_009811 [Chrysophaeum taylorii]|uniref:BAR domain-containing protein n=1 Tax=Chrysophaeum taylorii TaxID=2483200 RepID=A0AAD7XF77_9STRA|nr:hypothetical protein CTAYLR_009811 [Chrysophaeum taylorii]
MMLTVMMSLWAVVAARRRPWTLVARGGSDAAEVRASAALKGLESGMKSVEGLIVEIEAELANGKPYDGTLGSKFDEIYASGVSAFVSECNDPEARALFETALDARLELLYMKHVSATRARLLAQFKPTEPFDEVDAKFEVAAEAAKRAGAPWDSAAERGALKAVLTELKSRADRASTVGAKAAAQQSSYMQLFQTYQAQIQQLQAAVQSAPPQVALAYRVPDTDVSISATRQADRTTLTLGCVPDDSAPLLGPNGFVKGVTPANVGLTLNLHV